jgi:putative Holliday junction resolvase
MNGDIGESGQMALDFKEMLLQSGLVSVTMWDERLTTVAAQRLLISADVSRKKRKEVIDQVAAVGILQSYLDRK